MLLNTKKTNGMIFNFCKEFQFTSRIQLESEIMEIVSETKLLGVIVNSNLSWDENTKHLVKKANARMRILHKLVSFSVTRKRFSMHKIFDRRGVKNRIGWNLEIDIDTKMAKSIYEFERRNAI